MSKENNISRIDPENRMGLEWHAARVLGRKKEDGTPEFEGLNPEARREAIQNATFREGDEVRNTLLRVLDRIEGVRTPEQQQLLDSLMGQRQQVASVWTEKFPIEGAPTQVELMAGAERFLQGLPTEVLQGFLELCPDSTQLVFRPGQIADPELLKAMKNGEIWTPELWNDVKTYSWKVGLTDGREDLEFDPSIYYLNPEAPERRTNEQMVAEYKNRFSERGLTIMPQHGYLPTMATKLANRQVIDARYWTAFEKPVNASLLPFARWCLYGVYLSNGLPSGSRDFLRCRPWVEGDIA